MKWKVLAIIASSLLLLTAAALFWNPAFRSLLPGIALNPPTVVAQVQRLNALASVKYTLQRVVGLNEPKDPIGEESILMMVQGEALAGIDLSCLQVSDLTVSSSRMVRIRLPKARIISVYIDEKQTKVWDRHITWWTPWVPPDPDLEHKTRLAAIGDIRSAAMKMGILDEAEKNARSVLSDFFAALHIHAEFP